MECKKERNLESCGCTYAGCPRQGVKPTVLRIPLGGEAEVCPEGAALVRWQRLTRHGAHLYRPSWSTTDRGGRNGSRN